MADRPEVEIIEFSVPLLPPSVNHYIKHTRTGRHYVTKEATAFKEAVALLCRERVRFKSYYVEIWLNLGPKERMDVDNCAKVILDALKDAEIIHSDAAVTDLTMHKRRGRENRTCVTIWQPSHDIVKKGRK